jgi:hypothetical protein
MSGTVGRGEKFCSISVRKFERKLSPGSRRIRWKDWS